MDEKTKRDLARRAVACPGWRWLPGMRTLDGWRVVALHALGDGVLRGWNEDVWRDGIVPADALPDLDDPATLGCLLAIVREAWPKAPATTDRHGTSAASNSERRGPMRERPILFSSPMVRAILGGKKIQTRREVKPQPPEGYRFTEFVRDPALSARFENRDPPLGMWTKRCPFGAPGDRLWVRETWAPTFACVSHEYEEHDVYEWCEDIHGPLVDGANSLEIYYRADGEDELPAEFSMPDGSEIRWRPSIHMPRWASRITLEITGVRVERLGAITEEDARAEGVEPLDSERFVDTEETDPSICRRCGGTRLHNAIGSNMGVIFDVDCTDCDTHRKRFHNLWTHIYGAESWAANPWVWVVSFRRIGTTAQKARNGSEVARGGPSPRAARGWSRSIGARAACAERTARGHSDHGGL